jgi:hypothetical protein
VLQPWCRGEADGAWCGAAAVMMAQGSLLWRCWFRSGCLVLAAAVKVEGTRIRRNPASAKPVLATG